MFRIWGVKIDSVRTLQELPNASVAAFALMPGCSCSVSANGTKTGTSFVAVQARMWKVPKSNFLWFSGYADFSWFQLQYLWFLSLEIPTRLIRCRISAIIIAWRCFRSLWVLLCVFQLFWNPHPIFCAVDIWSWEGICEICHRFFFLLCNLWRRRQAFTMCPSSWLGQAYQSPQLHCRSI